MKLDAEGIEELVLAAQKGDQAAYETLWPPVHSYLWGVFHRSHFSLPEDEVEGLIDEAVVEAVRVFRSGGGKFSALLAVVFRRTCSHYVRKKTPLPTVPLDEVGEDLPAPRQILPEEQMIQEEERKLLEQAFGQLSNTSRLVIQLKLEGGLDESKIAGIACRLLRLESVNVSSTYYNDKQRLRRILGVE